MKKKNYPVATVAKYGDLFCLNPDEDNPTRHGNPIGKKTSRSDHAKSYPDWLPSPLKEEALFIIFNLRRKYNLDQIFNFIAWREEASPLMSEPVPKDEVDKIDALIYIQRLIELGKEKGIKAYLGEGSEKVYRAIVERGKQSDRAKKKAGTIGYLKRSLKKICQSINSTSFDDFKKAIKDQDSIEDLFHSLSDPIDIRDFQINDDYLLYVTRQGKEQNRKLRTIRSILLEIKKELNL